MTTSQTLCNKGKCSVRFSPAVRIERIQRSIGRELRRVANECLLLRWPTTVVNRTRSKARTEQHNESTNENKALCCGDVCVVSVRVITLKHTDWLHAPVTQATPPSPVDPEFTVELQVMRIP